MKSKTLFPFIIFLSAIALTSCSFYNPSQSKYSDFNAVTNETLFSQTEDEYAVYVYGENCSKCNDIKETVFTYIHTQQTSQKDLLPIYLLDAEKYSTYLKSYQYDSSLSEEENYQKCFELSKDCSKTEDLYLSGTPTLYFIKKDSTNTHKLSNELIGAININTYLYKAPDNTTLIISLCLGAGLFLLILGVIRFIIYKKKAH